VTHDVAGRKRIAGTAQRGADTGAARALVGRRERGTALDPRSRDRRASRGTAVGDSSVESCVSSTRICRRRTLVVSASEDQEQAAVEDTAQGAGVAR
jgi:hypothetical protein